MPCTRRLTRSWGRGLSGGGSANGGKPMRPWWPTPPHNPGKDTRQGPTAGAETTGARDPWRRSTSATRL
eukprot:8197055-Pyramimonas_sp.AAC.1